MEIAAVIVTFNRLECLKKALPLYTSQTYLPKCMIVVDNHSTDGTAEYLAQWQAEPSPVEKIVLTLSENTGGAGGFHAGMKRALQTDCDWIWVADDDAYPEASAMQAFFNFENRNTEVMEKVVALCGTIINYEKDKILTGHHCRTQKILGVPFMVEVPEEEYKKEYFFLDYISYVGSMIRRETLERVGLPRKDFFIYSDDWEHSIRIREAGKIICVTESCVAHVGESAQVTKTARWHDYYATRNTLVALKIHYGKAAFALRAMCRMLTALFSGNKEKIRVFWAGICDAYHDRMGVHPIYKPGWKSKDVV